MELPPSFVEDMRALMPDANDFLAALQTEQPVSIRLNSLKLDTSTHPESYIFPASYPAALRGQGEVRLPQGSVRVPWCESGYYLPSRPAFTFDPLFHAGGYYVQEAASMFLEQAMRRYVGVPCRMLDLCAAPGGKSSLASTLLPKGSLLVANEVIRQRSQILAENLTKWGCPNTIVTNSDPADFGQLDNFFDVLLTDVPCSGEGMFRKDPVAVSEWSPQNVELCYQRQRRILSDVWPSLKPGGIAIYSTCTYNVHEDEENIAWICQELGAEVLELPVSADWGITGNLLNNDFPVYRFLPHKTRGEGLFMAVLRKTGTSEPNLSTASWQAASSATARKKQKGGKQRSAVFPKEALQTMRSWVLDADNYEWTVDNELVTAFPQAHADALSALKQAVRIVQAGIQVGTLKGKDLIPHHALAMSIALNPDAFACEEVDYAQAVAYLRKEAVSLRPEASRGYVLLTYRGFPLGFAKNIGNRANNLYPQEWRIRSGYLPDEIQTL